MRVLTILKDKNTGKTVGYELEHNGIIKNVKKADITSIFNQYKIDNAILTRNGYVRGRDINLPTKYVNSKTSNCKKGFTDFTNCEVVPYFDLGGVAHKIIIKDSGDTRKILKFPRQKLGVSINDHITEFMACRMARILGYDVQSVELGYYRNLECVAVTMFASIPKTFEGLGAYTLEGVTLDYNLDGLLKIEMNYKFSINQEVYTEWVWRVFVLDMFLGNFDRHQNNWGFLKRNEFYYPSTLYDFGSSLYSKAVLEDKSQLSDSQIKHIIEFKTRSAILYGGKKRTYTDLFKAYKNDTNLLKYLTVLLDTYENSNFDPIYNEVVNFNSIYSNHVEFIKRVLDMKLKLFRGYLK